MRVLVAVLVLSVLDIPYSLSQTSLGGFLEYDNITYFKRMNDKINGRNQGILQLEVRHQVNQKAKIFGSVEVRDDQADASRNRIYLDEAYIDLYLGDFDLRIGKQIYAWGRADGFNPTDNLTSWDYSDVLDTDDEKIGLISARVTYYFGDWSLDGVLAPSFPASLLPKSSSRWWPELPPTISNPAFPSMGKPSLAARYTIASPRLPDDGFKSTQYALKLSGTSGGWDYSLSWFDGFDDLPSIHMQTVVDTSFSSADITMQYQYHRRRAVGADAATTLGSIGVRGEAAYYITEDWKGVNPEIDDPYLQYVLGVDYTFKDLFPEKDLFVLLQWIQELQIPDRNTAYRMTDLNHIFRRSLMGKAELKFGEYTKVACEGVYNYKTKDWWLRPTVQWSISDGVQLYAGVDLLGGPPDSFFGPFKDDSRSQVRLKYSF